MDGEMMGIADVVGLFGGGEVCRCVWELLGIGLLLAGELAVLGQLVEPPL